MISTNSGGRELIDIVRQSPILLAPCPSSHGNNEVPVNYKAIIDVYKDIYERSTDRFKTSYEKEISELRQEMKTMKDEAHEQERLHRQEHFEYLDIQIFKCVITTRFLRR